MSTILSDEKKDFFISQLTDFQKEIYEIRWIVKKRKDILDNSKEKCKMFEQLADELYTSAHNIKFIYYNLIK